MLTFIMLIKYFDNVLPKFTLPQLPNHDYIVVFNPFYDVIKLLVGLLRKKCVFKHQYLQIFGLKLNNYE